MNCAFRPISYIRIASSFAYQPRILNIVTSWTIVPFANRWININTMHSFSIPRIRENDSDKLLVVSDWIYFSAIVFVLNLTHSFFSLFHSCSVSLFRNVLLIFLWVSSPLFFNEVDLHFVFILFIFAWLRFKTVYFWAKNTCLHLFVRWLEIFLVGRVVASGTSVGRDDIELG